MTPTIPHLGLAKTIGLLYLYIVRLMAIVRVSYGYGYNRGSGRVINNGTDIYARCVRNNNKQVATRSLHFYRKVHVICTDLPNFKPPRRSYDVIAIFQDGGHGVANLLPVAGLVTELG